MPAEIRSPSGVAEVSQNRLTGYAAVFNKPADIGGEFLEVIDPKAFDASLRHDDIRALLGHDSCRVLGRQSSQTLKLWTDNVGLRFDLEVDPATPDGATVLSLVRRGDLTGCSFGFVSEKADWTPQAYPALPIRRLLRVRLREVSIVAWPAYSETSIRIKGSALEESLAVAESSMRLRGLI